MTMTDHDSSSFGALLHTFRKRAHLTQQKLARRLKLANWGTRQLLEASLTVPAHYFLVPLLRSPYFTGREEILETLHAQLGVDRTVALTQSSTLSRVPVCWSPFQV